MPSSMPSSMPSTDIFLCDSPVSVGIASMTDNKFVAETVLTFINSRNDWNSVAPRVKDVTPNGCAIFMHNPSNSSHGAETVSYFVAEKGRYELHGGAIFEAGSHDTSTAHQGGDGYIGDQLSFSAPFQNVPA
eukprot:11604213-Ditylum_brightwellii.AAC.1